MSETLWILTEYDGGIPVYDPEVFRDERLARAAFARAAGAFGEAFSGVNGEAFDPDHDYAYDGCDREVRLASAPFRSARDELAEAVAVRLGGVPVEADVWYGHPDDDVWRDPTVIRALDDDTPVAYAVCDLDSAPFSEQADYVAGLLAMELSDA